MTIAGAKCKVSTGGEKVKEEGCTVIAIDCARSNGRHGECTWIPFHPRISDIRRQRGSNPLLVWIYLTRWMGRSGEIWPLGDWVPPDPGSTFRINRQEEDRSEVRRKEGRREGGKEARPSRFRASQIFGLKRISPLFARLRRNKAKVEKERERERKGF